MKEVFLTILNMSISSSFIIMAVLVLRWLCRKLPKRWTIFIWLLAAFRMLLPVSFSSDVSVFRYSTVVNGQVQHIADPTSAIVDVLSENAVLPVSNASHNYMEFIVSNLYILWMLITLILIIRMVLKCIKLQHCLKESILLEDNIYINDQISGPFIFGMIRPKIYLPSTFDKQNKEAVILHEQAHLHRKDYIFKPIVYLLLCVYWFNPMAWIGYYFFSLDMEMACDETATRYMNVSEKADYSALLLSMAYPYMDYVPALPFAKQGISQRIKNLVQTHKQPFWMILLLVVVLMISSLALLSNPKIQEPKRNAKAKELYQHRSDFIEKEAQVQPIMNLLAVPEGLRFENVKIIADDMIMQELQLLYEGTFSDRTSMHKTFIKNALLIFGLTQNINVITYTLPGMLTARYTRDDIFRFYPVYDHAKAQTLEEFEELYEMSMAYESMLDELLQLPIDLSLETAVQRGFYIDTAERENTQTAQTFFADAKAGKDCEMTFVQSTKEGDLLIHKIKHDIRGYHYVKDATRDTYGNQNFESYHMMYVVEIPLEEGSDIYLTSEKDLNSERIQRAEETGEFINMLYLYHIE